jgi:hypothetical protein
MLRLLAALVALLSGGLPFAHPHDAGAPPAVAASSQALVVDASALPGPSGWFFERITADRDVLVTLDGTWRDAAASGGGPHASALLFDFAGHAPIVSSAAATDDATVEVDAAGHRVACCDAASEGAGLSRQHAEGIVGPDQPLWIGLVTDAWSPQSALQLTLTPHGGALRADAPLRGSAVQSYDLVQLARAAGTEARAYGVTLAGRAGEGALHRVPEHAAFLSVVASAHGLDEETLHVALPNGTPLPAHIVRHGDASLQAIKRGPIDVRLDDVRDESLSTLDEDTHSSLLAVALYADVDAPLDGFAMSIHEDDDQP